MGLPVPNPVTVSAGISFSTPSAGRVSLSVFDITGRRVETIVSEEMSAGSHMVQWQPEQVSSGVYFIRLVTEEGSVTRQVMVVR
jgi:flagellar hook assembly protein FlgD